MVHRNLNLTSLPFFSKMDKEIVGVRDVRDPLGRKDGRGVEPKQLVVLVTREPLLW